MLVIFGADMVLNIVYDISLNLNRQILGPACLEDFDYISMMDKIEPYDP